MKKVLMLATTAAMIEQFNKSNIEVLNSLGYIVDMAGNFHEGNPISKEVLDDFRVWIQARGGNCFHISSVRNPLSLKKNCNAYKSLIRILKENEYDFIHVHTPIGSVLGRMAAHQLNIPIIYTAHGFHFFDGAPIKNWLLYYPVEKFLSRWTDVLVTINQEDYERAKKKFHAKKTEYVPGVGIDLKKFQIVDEKKDEKRNEFGIKENDIVLLSVGELNENKNHQLIIQAMAKLQKENLYYIVCGQGPLRDVLMDLAESLGIANKVYLAGYRSDVKEFYQMADIFVFPSLREGLSVAMMEAMACELPIICSKIRGNTDLVKDQFSGRLSGNNPEEIGNIILEMINNPNTSKDYGRNAYKELQRYSVENVNQLMSTIYQSFQE